MDQLSGQAPDKCPWRSSKFFHRACFNTESRTNVLGGYSYSLPESDTYVKYLLKAATADARDLERVDVLCYDEDGSVKRKYESFLRLDKVRFQHSKTEQYLGHVRGKIGSTTSEGVVKLGYGVLETAHDEAFRGATRLGRR